MSSPYTSTPVSGYNVNPPPDDGTTAANNLITWAMAKTKLGDPLNAFATAVDAALVTAFAKTISGASVATAASAYPAGAADQGRLIRTTAANVVVTTPDATSVGSPFVFAVLNNSTGGASVAGFGGTQTIDGQLSTALASGDGLLLFSDGSNWFTAGQSSTAIPIIPQGRLTLVSGTPVMNADVTATTLIYYTPYLGNQIPIPTGSVFKANTFSELTLTINGTNYVGGTIYDVFIFLDPSDNATVRIGTGPAWSNSGAGTGARGTGAGTTEITRLNGLWANNNAITMRNNATTYAVLTKKAICVGSIFIDATNGQISCHFSAGQSRKFGVANIYNRIQTVLQVFDTGSANWNYNTATIRQSNGAAGNKGTVFSSVAEEPYRIQFNQKVKVTSPGTSGDAHGIIGIGYNSTTAFSGTTGDNEVIPVVASAETNMMNLIANFTAPASIGINAVNCCENASTVGTANFHSTSQQDMIMEIAWAA